MARGTIISRARADGSTAFVIKYRTADGTQVKRVVPGGRREAERELAKALSGASSGALKSVNRDAFEDAAYAWLERKRPRIEPSTYNDYETHLRLRLVPAFGTLKLQHITREKIELYLARLDREGRLSRKTINDSLIPLRQILSLAVRQGRLPANPALSTDRDDPLELPYEQPAMLFMSREEANRYLDSCSESYQLLAEVLLGTGARIGEALALEWRDLSWDTNSIRIERALKKRRGSKIAKALGGPKGDRPRTVFVAPYVMDLLRRERDARREAGTLGKLVFVSETGDYRDHDNVRNRGHFHAVRDAALNPDLRLHDLRHTAAALWLGHGESIYFVKEQLGHADIQTTIDLYGHPDQAAHAEAAARAGQWRSVRHG
ncbi:MAG: tyrosine-type recombinase/integrase [Solirubrobacteraceae bacterium]